MTTETILTDEDLKNQKINLGVTAPDEFFNMVARAIEQAVLQSPEIQALRRDAAMLDWLDATNAPFLTGWRTSVTSFGNVALHTVSQPVGRLSTIRSAITAAMEQKT